MGESVCEGCNLEYLVFITDPNREICTCCSNCKLLFENMVDYKSIIKK